MSNISQLPPERDLPADRHARLRTRVLTKIAEPATRRPTVASRLPVRLAAAGLAMAACVAIGWVGIGGLSGSGQQREVYALGDGVLSPRAREAGRECLKIVRRDGGQEPGTEPFSWPTDEPPVLLNHIDQQRRGAIAIYEAQSKLIYCAMGPAVKPGPEPRETTDDGWAIAVALLDSSQWLPGPISLEDASSTDREGGYVQAAGRISQRVARVALADGAGHKSTAQLDQGTFVVSSDSRIEAGAVIISYDARGKEIDRRPALGQPEGRCYTDPAGNLVNPTSNYAFELAYKSSKIRCKPAEPWSRRNSVQPTRR